MEGRKMLTGKTKAPAGGKPFVDREILAGNKALADTLATVIVDLIVIGLIVIFYLLLQIGQLDIHTMVKEAGVERHTLNLGQALLSYDKLVYIEDDADYTYIHRGVLAKEKLDAQFAGDSSSATGSSIATELGYPDSDIRLYVKDFETGEEWALSYNGPFSAEGTRLVSDLTCLAGKIKIDITMIFRSPIGNPWEYLDVQSCMTSDASSYGSGVKSFPVAIKDGSEIHNGILEVAVWEWW